MAKRAELARFPPKDPGKLSRLRKEISKMIANPKKANAVEKRATHAKKYENAAHDAHLVESLIIVKLIVDGVKRRTIGEGLYKEDAQPSQWDEFIKKVSGKALENDKGFQRVMSKLDAAMDMTFKKSLKLIQKELGAAGRVKPLGVKKHEDGRSYASFNVISNEADVGPIYIYSEGGTPKIEMSDKAKAAFGKIAPESSTKIRAVLSSVQDAIEQTGEIRNLIAQRDDYLTKLEDGTDKMVAGMTPLQLSMLKRILVAKYRGTK